MKYSIAVLAVIVLVAFAQCAAFADAPQGPYKWTQLPKMSDAYDFSSEIKASSVMADDWECRDPRPVIDVHWWGSYWYPDGGYIYYSDGKQSVPKDDRAPIRSFTIKFWTDVPAGQGEVFSRPGALLETYQITDFNETHYGVSTYTNFPGLVEDVYQYYAVLPTPFAQTPGTIYWISIQADMPASEPNQQWGWHQSEVHWNDFAVQDWNGSSWYPPCGGVDMAFELSIVPEPGSLAVLLSGAAAVGGVLIRRRRAV